MGTISKNLQRREDVSGYGNSRFNAVKHGILSKYTILPWEDKGEYDALHVSLVEEHRPVGPTEEHLVEELTGIIWRKRRLRLAEAASFRRGLRDCIEESGTLGPHSNSTAAAALVAAGQSSSVNNHAVAEAIHGDPNVAVQRIRELQNDLKKVEKALATLRDGRAADAYERALKGLKSEIRDEWYATLEEAEEESEPTYSANAEDLAEWIQIAEQTTIQRQLTALIHRDAIREQAFGRAFEPDSLEKLARYETYLDRKLERNLAVLVKLQELRRDREKQEPSPGNIDEESSGAVPAD